MTDNSKHAAIHFVAGLTDMRVIPLWHQTVPALTDAPCEQLRSSLFNHVSQRPSLVRRRHMSSGKSLQHSKRLVECLLTLASSQRVRHCNVERVIPLKGFT